jgi:hypothetical protein
MHAPADSQRTSEPVGPSQEVTEWSKKFNGRRLTKPNEDIFIGKGAMGAEKLFQSILRGETDWMTPVVRGATKYETARNLFESENFWTDETPGYERSYLPITQRILEATTLDNPGEWLGSRKVSKFQELPDDKLSSLVFANDAAQYTPISGRRFFELMDATGDAGPSIVLGLGKRVGLFSRSLFTRDDRLTAKPVAIFDTREFLAKLNDKAASLSNSAPYAENAERAFKELLILALEKPKAKEGNGQLGDMLASAPAYYKEVRQMGGRPISSVEFANAVMKAVRELSPQRGAHFFWHGIGRISQNDAKTLINLKSSSFHAKDSVLQRAVAILEEEAAPKATPT